MKRKDGHTLILGVTESGKSTYAKWLCRHLNKKGVRTAVLNPYYDPGWECEFQTQNAEDLYRYAWMEKRLAIFIEEAGQSLARNPRYDWFTSKARHWGHRTYPISQRLNDLTPGLRFNCNNAVIFASEADDVQALASKYREPLLLDVEKFSPGEFYSVAQFAETIHGQLDWKKQTIIARIARAQGKAKAA